MREKIATVRENCCAAGTSSRTYAILFGNPPFGSNWLQRGCKMAPTPPLVQGEQLTYQQDGQSAQVTVGSAAWFRWLETASTFTYHTEHGTFTARLERSG